MPTFEAPTYLQAFRADPRAMRFGVPGLFQRMSFEVGYVVLITDGVATPSPGVAGVTSNQADAADAGSGESGKGWFRGGKTYTVTTAEKTILEAAGYVVT